MRTGGRRSCYACGRRIDVSEEAFRATISKGWPHSQRGRVRYWLCWRCGTEVEKALAGVADLKAKV